MAGVAQGWMMIVVEFDLYIIHQSLILPLSECKGWECFHSTRKWKNANYSEWLHYMHNEAVNYIPTFIPHNGSIY